MNKLTYEEYLEKYGKMTYTNVGISMLPMMKQGRDLFTVVKKSDSRCKKYDVVLYRRPPSHYVLHRIVEVRENDYVILGDNCVNKEYGIKDDDIIAVLSEFVRNGKKYTVDDKNYQFYSKLWYFIYPIRKLIMKIKFKLRRFKK